MPQSILIGKKAPYCPGCGHHVVTNDLAGALQDLRVNPLNVVVVSDIGCCGLVDGLLSCHTVHGLHGRSTALALGISLGLNDSRKKVIVIQGDGGATIGLQHILEAARQNVDLTLIIQNNFVYGMTGGQISGLSPAEFKEIRLPHSGSVPAYDICQLAHRAGAAFSTRVFVGGDIAGALREAIRSPGFSLVEVVEMCPAHGVQKVRDLRELSDYQEVMLTNSRNLQSVSGNDSRSLIDILPVIEERYCTPLTSRLEMLLAGSAGEGIQMAGDLLAAAGLSAGLMTTKKGEYPITVGSGFSLAEVIYSPAAIHYSGIENPDVMFVVSEDGYQAAKNRIGEKTILVVDRTLEAVVSNRKIIDGDFRKAAGKKGAALCALAYWLKHSRVLPLEALIKVAGLHKHGEKLVAAIDSAATLE